MASILGRAWLAVPLCAALAAAMARADERRVLAEGRPVALPLGTLSWSALDVRAGEPVARASQGPRIAAEGEWEIALEAPGAQDANRHGLTLELALGLRARQGASYEAVRIDGLAEPVELEATIADVDGHETPVMALAMGSRVYVEVLGVRAGATLKLRSSAHAPVEHAPDEPAPVSPMTATLPCGGGGPCEFVHVSAGTNHSLALTPVGEVRAWGSNSYGQLGDGSTADRLTPVAVLGPGGSGVLTGIAQVAAGDTYSLALTTGGQVRTWGNNVEGRLGDGTTTRRLVPVVVKGVGGTGALAGITQVATGGGHALALTSTGEVRAWGVNYYGELGTGTLRSSSLPLVVLGVGGLGALSGVQQVAAGSLFNVALTTGGDVLAWGLNGHGQIGDGTTSDRTSPVAVAGVGGIGTLSGVVQVAAGYEHALALTSGGEVRAWGSNVHGELGDGTNADRWTPVTVLDVGASGRLSSVSRIAAGYQYSVVLTTSGEARAWGINELGQLGDGTLTARTAPVVVRDANGIDPLSGISAVAAGPAHCLALTTGGEVRAWGSNGVGQLGDSTSNSRAVVTCVKASTSGAGPPYFVQVAAGGDHSLALADTGEVMAWGDNSHGQLGDGTFAPRTTPVAVLDVGGSGPLSGIAQVAAGGLHSLALTTGGEVRAWGDNARGQLGDGTNETRSTPVTVVDVLGSGALTSVAQVSAGERHSLALTASGEVRSWGENRSGELGDGTFSDHAMPVVVRDASGSGPLSGIAQVSAGGFQSLALTTGGEVRAWGNNYQGELGDGTTTDRPLPVVVRGVGGWGWLAGITQVVAGGTHSLALTSGGEVRAWGLNSDGQLGDGTSIRRLVPGVVLDPAGGRPLRSVVHVAAGTWHSLALTMGGEVFAWGRNDVGMLGDGTTIARRRPVMVLDSSGSGALSGVQQLSAGRSHSLGLMNVREVRAWGGDTSSQLGDGHADANTVPIETVCWVPNTPPTCSVGPASTSSCGQVPLIATADDADGDPLSYAWFSSCPGAQFTPSADVLQPSVLLSSNCAASCDLTLAVNDGRGGTCSSTVHVTVDDITPPTIACPGNVVLLCTDSVPGPDPALVTATDSCSASVTVVHVGDAETGTCPKRIARTYRATDACGNSAECVQYLTQFDHVPETDCANGADDDGDTLVDCADDDCLWIPDHDCDGDGAPNGTDCAPDDASAFAAPGDVPRLDVAKAGADAALAWTDMATTAGSGTVHDVVGGTISELRADRGFARATCVARDVAGDSATDARPLPVRALGAPADGYWYLMRAQNACGTAPWGDGSLGPRVIDALLCE